MEIATDSTLSHLQRLGLYTEAFLTDIVHQTNEAESVVEYACAATNDQMYSVGEETEIVPNTFEEATITGSRWVYKINAEKSIGQPRLVPTALERPSPSRRGTVISAPEKSTSGNEPASMGMPNTDDRDLGRRVDDDIRGTGTDEIKNGAMDHEKGGEDEGDPQEGELRSGQRRNEVRRKSDSGRSLRSSLCIYFDVFYGIRLVTRKWLRNRPLFRLCESFSFSQINTVALNYTFFSESVDGCSTIHQCGPSETKGITTGLIPPLDCRRPRCVSSSVLTRVGIPIRPFDFNGLTSRQKNLKTTRRMLFLVSLFSVLRLSSFFLPMERR